MNEYRLSELSPGHSEEFSVRIEQKMMDMFSEITGDTNPLHTSSQYANKMGYSDRVVYGLLTCSFLSTLLGMYLPGKYSLIQEVNARLRRPVYVGDVLNIVGQIKRIDYDVKRIELNVTIRNQSGNLVLTGAVKAGCIDYE